MAVLLILVQVWSYLFPMIFIIDTGVGMHHDDATMMAWSEEPYIAVNFNYR